MINFRRLSLAEKPNYEQILFSGPTRGCEYSFANLFLWGRQQAAIQADAAAFFSHFYGRSVYPYPIGGGDRRALLEAIIQDAAQRGIPCRITNLTQADCQELESWFPGKFAFQSRRESFDYVYAIQDLATLKGRKYQKKRNHFNRFTAQHPQAQLVPMTQQNIPLAEEMVEQWFACRLITDPHGDYLLEKLAIARAFRNFQALELEGALLVEGEQVLAVTMASRLSQDTMDVHFEKAREDVDGAYTAVNCLFARYLMERHPELMYLDREDDLGIEGLRQAKLSYHPHHMIEKSWAYLREDAR